MRNYFYVKKKSPLIVLVFGKKEPQKKFQSFQIFLISSEFFSFMSQDGIYIQIHGNKIKILNGLTPVLFLRISKIPTLSDGFS